MTSYEENSGRVDFLSGFFFFDVMTPKVFSIETHTSNMYQNSFYDYIIICKKKKKHFCNIKSNIVRSVRRRHTPCTFYYILLCTADDIIDSSVKYNACVYLLYYIVTVFFPPRSLEIIRQYILYIQLPVDIIDVYIIKHL